MRSLWFYLIALLSMFALSGCQNVQTEANPTRSGLYSSPFSLSSDKCKTVVHGNSQLPVDLFHAGQCYEQGVGVKPSVDEAVELYSMAARWGIPEAGQALTRLGKPVPPADLLKRRDDFEEQINQQRLDKEKLNIYKNRDHYPSSHYHFHGRRYCGRYWCY